jgi:hypothetical protein
LNAILLQVGTRKLGILPTFPFQTLHFRRGDDGNAIFFMAEKTFLLIETVVSTSDKIFCMTNTTVPVG